MFSLYIGIGVAIFEFYLGTIVLVRKKMMVHYVFSIMCLFMGLWTLCLSTIIVGPIIPNDFVLRIVADAMLVFGFLISQSILIFSEIFPDQNKKITPLYLFYLISTFLLIFTLVVLTKIIIKNIDYSEVASKKVQLNPTGNIVYSLFFIVNLIYASINFIRKYLSSKGMSRTQLSYVGFGIIVSLGLGGIFDVIFPLFGNTQFVSISALFLFPFLLVTSYTILKYRLLDVEIVVKRTTIYMGFIIVITGFYSFLLFLPHGFVGKPGSLSSFIIMFIGALILAITIQPLRDWLDNVTDKIFFQKKIDYYITLEKISKNLNKALRFEDVMTILAKPCIEDMHLKNVAVYIRERTGGTFTCQQKYGEAVGGFPEYIYDDNSVLAYLTETREIIETGEFRHKYGHILDGPNSANVIEAEILKYLNETFPSELLIPLILKNIMIGILVLGEKKSGDQYSHRDLVMFETLASQVATTLENIRLYEHMLNNERLTIIGAMSAGIAHEIRNPLASLKTFIQMLPEKYHRPEFRVRFDEIVPSEIERISGITADLLAFSKPSAPTLESVNMDHALDRIVTLLHNQMKKKQITVVKNYDILPTIKADAQQISQVLMNLILNAIQASRLNAEIKVTIVIQVKGNPNRTEDQWMNVTVEDHGEGIKKKDTSSIFQPFFTTKTEGTGLGLATCKRIMEAHHGDLYFESIEGQGAKFTFTIPCALTEEKITKI